MIWSALALMGSLLVIPAAHAREMQLTIYDDGAACPGKCDAHVVFRDADNASRYAFAPSSSRAAPIKCDSGMECIICFSDFDASCMRVLYRGNGPKEGRFDFTPAFYNANCSRSDVPKELTAQCQSLEKSVKTFHYDMRLNCFDKPTDVKCAEVMREAKAAQDADIPKRESCLKDVTAFNKAQKDPKERRMPGCDYTELSLGGKPSNPWHKLLPGACRSGESFVDPFGLDCCSKDVRFAAANHPECIEFFPR